MTDRFPIRWRIAQHLITWIGLIVGGRNFAYTRIAASQAAVVELRRQRERRDAGLPMDDWALEFADWLEDQQ